MIEMGEVGVRPSSELAYWIGVVQTDGSLYKYSEKGRRMVRHMISFEVSKNSLPMLIKFKELSELIFKRKSGIWRTKRSSFAFHIRVTALIETFKSLDIKFKDPPRPSLWIVEKPEFLGAYLSGVIDGDGDVRIKRQKYPQCAIRISSGHTQTKLQDVLEKKLKCGTSISKVCKKSYLSGRVIEGSAYSLEFLVSSKTYEFFKEFILPYIQLNYKKMIIKEYIKLTWGSSAS